MNADDHDGYQPLSDDETVADELADGSLDPDELETEPAWWDEGSDDET